MYRLGLNTGFAVNRFAEPQEWTRVFKILNIKYAQFTADLLNVSLPDKIIHEQTKLINEHCYLNDVKIVSAFTGAFTRVNHLAHPDKNIRDYWVSWFKRYIDLAIEIGAKNIGSHPGILTEKDDNDLDRRRERVNQNVECWHEIANYAKKKDIDYISWEPMSISREQGHTIAATKELNKKLNENSPLPFKICLDVDHGDKTSVDLNDRDPYQWLENFIELAPQVHLKQSLNENSYSNYPFLDKYNKEGIIKADRVINILKKKNIKNIDLILELNFKERNPIDKLVIEYLNESILYWKRSIDNNKF